MPILWPVLLAAWTTTPTAAAKAPPTQVMRVAARQDQLRAGDELSIRIWRVGGARVTVDAERKLRHPLFGELDVSGWTMEDLREAIAQKHGCAQVVIWRTSLTQGKR